MKMQNPMTFSKYSSDIRTITFFYQIFGKIRLKHYYGNPPGLLHIFVYEGLQVYRNGLSLMFVNKTCKQDLHIHWLIL